MLCHQFGGNKIKLENIVTWFYVVEIINKNYRTRLRVNCTKLEKVGSL